MRENAPPWVVVKGAKREPPWPCWICSRKLVAKLWVWYDPPKHPSVRVHQFCKGKEIIYSYMEKS